MLSEVFQYIVYVFAFVGFVSCVTVVRGGMGSRRKGPKKRIYTALIDGMYFSTVNAELVFKYDYDTQHVYASGGEFFTVNTASYRNDVERISEGAFRALVKHYRKPEEVVEIFQRYFGETIPIYEPVKVRQR